MSLFKIFQRENSKTLFSFLKVKGTDSSDSTTSGTTTFSLPSEDSDLKNLSKTETGDADKDTVLMVSFYSSILFEFRGKDSDFIKFV